MWDSGRLEEMDLVLAEAAKAGVKLIIPIVNQDTGEECVQPSPIEFPASDRFAPREQLELGRVDG